MCSLVQMPSTDNASILSRSPAAAKAGHRVTEQVIELIPVRPSSSAPLPFPAASGRAGPYPCSRPRPTFVAQSLMSFTIWMNSPW